jgi:hypothetical protein
MLIPEYSKVKIINGASLKELEEAINKWLEENSILIVSSNLIETKVGFTMYVWYTKFSNVK